MATLESILSQEIVPKNRLDTGAFLMAGGGRRLYPGGSAQSFCVNSSANLRYIIACVALALMVVLPLITLHLCVASMLEMVPVLSARAKALATEIRTAARRMH